MRVQFFDPDNDDLSPQAKGRLLEHLTRRILERLGYAEIVLRAKHSSLEYDVEGRDRLTGTLLTGEAKAHDAKIDGQNVAAFIGKVLPLAAKHRRLNAVFISTSPLTSEAQDYLDSNPTQQLPSIQLRVLAGEAIAQFLENLGMLAQDDLVRSRIRTDYTLEALDTWMTTTSRDHFIVATVAPNLVSPATGYVTLASDGSSLELEGSIAERLERQLPDLAGLQRANPGGSVSPAQRRLPTVLAGAGWFDYKFPTSPDHFVGRDEEIREVLDVVSAIRGRTTALRAIQVASRSGVGKSSLLLKLPERLASSVALTVDARSIRSPGDARTLVAQLAEVVSEATMTTIPLPRSQGDIDNALSAISEALTQSGLIALVQLDQFESVLVIPPAFTALLELIEGSTRSEQPIVWVVGRKNDVAVTFDDSATIDLSRFNDLTKTIGLSDFTPAEGRAMLDELGRELGQALRPDLSESISTFSGGFPWLHKRLCAHVLAMHANGVTQRELVQTGLRAEDLFEEDLNGLTEQDKGLLRTIAAHLPNTAAELARRLESEVGAARLTTKLNEFLGRKLLRLSGDIYDTYNDVFKTYLITQRIPFQTRFVFRVVPAATINLLRTIGELEPLDVSDLQQRLGGNPIAVLNKLRELRLLGLLEPTPGRVVLTREARVALQEGTLGELLRRALRGNALVVRVLDLVALSGDVRLESVAAELRRELPHVEVSNSTWNQYATILAAWLDYSGLVRKEGDALRSQESPPDGALKGRDFYRGTFKPGTFIPTVRPTVLADVVERLRAGSLNRSDLVIEFGINASGLLRDAAALDLLEVVDGRVRPGPQSLMLFARTDAVTARDVATLAASKPNMRSVLDASSKAVVTFDRQREITLGFGSTRWSESTWRWRLGILRSWLVATGLVRSGRGGLRPAPKTEPT